MMEMYRKKFSPLWPLLSGKDLDPDRLHPLLFLAVVSIGCMYGSPQQCKFGNILHEHIRKHVADSLIGLEEGGGDILWLGQTRLLTQVAALYFGQRRGFSYAQHLGAIIVAQARRMDLFSTLGSVPTGPVPIEQQLASWHIDESRKRLAFGILRADVFASVLLNTRPLLSAEEVYLDLPAEDDIWQELDKIPQHQLITRLRAERPGEHSLPFCDLVRVAEDRDETLLCMNARGYELLIFGLQGHIWRFSHDRTMFPRLTGLSDAAVYENSIPFSSFDRRHSILSSSQSDQLGITFRQMNDLRRDRRRITETLQKWEQSFTAVRTTPKFTKDRSSVLSSLLLLHISYLRLCAPLADLHSAAYTLMDKKIFDHKKWQALYEWAKSPQAIQAVGHVQHIWTLLSHEINQDSHDKAKCNLLAFSGLHHAAVVIWAFVGTHQEQTSELPELRGLENMVTIPLKRDCNGPILRNVVRLYKQLIPRGWYSFAAVAEYLAGHPFPGYHVASPP
ncbi:fungal-specific transcription factor domain-containing protein [Aspergillus pseudocaelatus]|uniref:Fungal-specific transcription factor domain-containing protein n=1 Tax=Aspergillus pseudocaelatus TaxID=1825620 RepID=A0ABQ6WWT1_9EURO|nr:fungal-specific transcription factor domain-containing protein [Aspergillus pseudocaelatus]